VVCERVAGRRDPEERHGDARLGPLREDGDCRDDHTVRNRCEPAKGEAEADDRRPIGAAPRQGARRPDAETEVRREREHGRDGGREDEPAERGFAEDGGGDDGHDEAAATLETERGRLESEVLEDAPRPAGRHGGQPPR